MRSQVDRRKSKLKTFLKTFQLVAWFLLNWHSATGGLFMNFLIHVCVQLWARIPLFVSCFIIFPKQIYVFTPSDVKETLYDAD